MNLLLLAAPTLALTVLGAHFYREGSLVPTLGCAALIALLALPRAWVARTVQLALLAGSAEWVWTTLMLAQQRLAMGRPWSRMALILGVVTVLTACSALVFRHARLRLRYRLG